MAEKSLRLEMTFPAAAPSYKEKNKKEKPFRSLKTLWYNERKCDVSFSEFACVITE